MQLDIPAANVAVHERNLTWVVQLEIPAAKVAVHEVKPANPIGSNQETAQGKTSKPHGG